MRPTIVILLAVLLSSIWFSAAITISRQLDPEIEPLDHAALREIISDGVKTKEAYEICMQDGKIKSSEYRVILQIYALEQITRKAEERTKRMEAEIQELRAKTAPDAAK